MADAPVKTKLLFVCTANRQRSPTAEGLFRASTTCEARSCGIDPLAVTPCSESLIDWADVIVCMEELHREALIAAYPPAAEKRIEVLHIPDAYIRDDPHLILQLRSTLKEWLD